jgi:hypothetical protein
MCVSIVLAERDAVLRHPHPTMLCQSNHQIVHLIVVLSICRSVLRVCYDGETNDSLAVVQMNIFFFTDNK